MLRVVSQNGSISFLYDKATVKEHSYVGKSGGIELYCGKGCDNSDDREGWIEIAYYSSFETAKEVLADIDERWRRSASMNDVYQLPKEQGQDAG